MMPPTNSMLKEDVVALGNSRGRWVTKEFGDRRRDALHANTRRAEPSHEKVDCIALLKDATTVTGREWHTRKAGVGGTDSARTHEGKAYG